MPDLNYSKYFATNMRTGKHITGYAREDYAFRYIADFITEQPKEDSAYIDCGIIWIEPNGTDSDWAVWCNYNDEPITAENADIGGNDYDMIEAIKRLIL